MGAPTRSITLHHAACGALLFLVVTLVVDGVFITSECLGYFGSDYLYFKVLWLVEASMLPMRSVVYNVFLNGKRNLLEPFLSLPQSLLLTLFVNTLLGGAIGAIIGLAAQAIKSVRFSIR